MIWATLDDQGVLHLVDEHTDRGERWALARGRGVDGGGVVVVMRECGHGHPAWLCSTCVPLLGGDDGQMHAHTHNTMSNGDT